MFLPLSALSWGYHIIFPHPQIHRTMKTLPHTPATKTMTMQLTTTQITSNADDNVDVNADKNNAMQMTEVDADDGQRCKQQRHHLDNG
jgi:hypothetical protein